MQEAVPEVPGDHHPVVPKPAGVDVDEEPAAEVLLVDDDERNLRAMRALLAGVPARLVEARSGEEALRCLLRKDFALILLDVQMPGMSGLETAALIRERERSRRTPIIFLTAFSRTDAQLLQGYRLGAVDFLTKPIVPEEVLRDKVSWFVELRRAQLLLERERERARAAELREHERAIVDARRRGEAEALRAEMDRQRALLERVKRSNDRLRVVASIASDLLLGVNPVELLPRLFGALSEHFGLEVYLLHLVGPDGGLALQAHGGVSEPLLGEIAALPQDGVIFARAARTRGTVVAQDLAHAAAEDFPALRRLGVTAGASFPLVAGERLLGTLTFCTRLRPSLEGDELSVLELVSDEVAMALERARLIDELQRRADELAAADRRKDEFLAVLAHELRNPLAPILNAVEILRATDATPGARGRALEAAGRQVRHMARLVGDLVDVSRIRSGKVELRKTRVDLVRVVEDAAIVLEPLAREQHQEVALDLPAAPLHVDGDAVRLTQVLENLLQNAVKYTDPGGHIRLAVAREGGEAVVRVVDDGIGIAPDLLPRVFAMFVQGDQPADRPRGGLGLGLTLVKSLVELHGGRVEGRSEGLGLGSTFEVRLPALAEETAQSAPPHAPADAEPALRPLRIALIEDNPDIRETLRELLERRGHAVVEAEDGPAGVDLVLAQKPDVALVDIGLPGLDGYEVAERVRAANGVASRLVALTGYGGPEDRGRAARAGFDAHLVKPVELAELSRVLERLV